MSRWFAWIVLVIAVLMLGLQLFVAEAMNVLVAGFWLLVVAGCVHALFFKKT